jgi:hypothetical protein
MRKNLGNKEYFYLNLFVLMIIGQFNFQCVPVDEFYFCDIHVNGKVYTLTQEPISNASVQINNTDECCSIEDNSCIHMTDSNGNWFLNYESSLNDIDICSITVSKEGYITKTQEYQYSCSEKDATVPVDVTVILEEEPQN